MERQMFFRLVLALMLPVAGCKMEQAGPAPDYGSGCIVVDDFETYTADSPMKIFETWIDGFGYTEPPPGKPGNVSGATVGYLDKPFLERTIVHGGSQSMPFRYKNTVLPFYSEIERQWAVPQDWATSGTRVLGLWVYGDPCNVPGPLYVALQDASGATSVVNHPDPNAVCAGCWNKWSIELSKFVGIHPVAVSKICIGVGDRRGLGRSVGGEGMLFIDDIELSRR
ncbi:MAG: hypothetical protein JSU70_21405 [Phycisphaerales bacterium]|nr:MAG: hypothetical protein JSU70_21405 [Phycisphaerales bacterium]